MTQRRFSREEDDPADLEQGADFTRLHQSPSQSSDKSWGEERSKQVDVGGSVRTESGMHFPDEECMDEPQSNDDETPIQGKDCQSIPGPIQTSGGSFLMVMDDDDDDDNCNKDHKRIHLRRHSKEYDA
jgi:hypothetical protein